MKLTTFMKCCPVVLVLWVFLLACMTVLYVQAGSNRSWLRSEEGHQSKPISSMSVDQSPTSAFEKTERTFARASASNEAKNAYPRIKHIMQIMQAALKSKTQTVHACVLKKATDEMTADVESADNCENRLYILQQYHRRILRYLARLEETKQLGANDFLEITRLKDRLNLKVKELCGMNEYKGIIETFDVMFPHLQTLEQLALFELSWYSDLMSCGIGYVLSAEQEMELKKRYDQLLARIKKELPEEVFRLIDQIIARDPFVQGDYVLQYHEKWLAYFALASE